MGDSLLALAMDDGVEVVESSRVPSDVADADSHEGVTAMASTFVDDDAAAVPPPPLWAMLGDTGVTDEQRIDREEKLQEQFHDVPLAEIQEALAAESYHVGKAARRLRDRDKDAPAVSMSSAWGQLRGVSSASSALASVVQPTAVEVDEVGGVGVTMFGTNLEQLQFQNI